MLSGWGLTSFKNGSLSSVKLQTSDYKVITSSECEDTMNNNKLEDNQMRAQVDMVLSFGIIER